MNLKQASEVRKGQLRVKSCEGRVCAALVAKGLAYRVSPLSKTQQTKGTEMPLA